MLAVNAEGVEHGCRVVVHLALKVVYLLADDAQRCTYLVGLVSLAAVYIFYARLDDLAFGLAYVCILLVYQLGGSLCRHVAAVGFSPCDVVVLALVHRVHHGHQLVEHPVVVAAIHR